jgi:sec-independent protein translocase protein TatB
MFGFSWSEILIIGTIALVVIGPNDLPRAMKTAARWMSAGRKLAREFQSHVDDLVREAELDELREQARKLAMTPLSQHVENFVDPDREIAKSMAPPDNLHELMTGIPTVTPVEEPPHLEPLAIANEPLPASQPSAAEEPQPAPAPKPRAKRKPKTIAAEAPLKGADATDSAP